MDSWWRSHCFLLVKIPSYGLEKPFKSLWMSQTPVGFGSENIPLCFRWGANSLGLVFHFFCPRHAVIPPEVWRMFLGSKCPTSGGVWMFMFIAVYDGGGSSWLNHQIWLRISRWWFQTLVFFATTWGNDPIWRAYFSDGWFNHQPPHYFWVTFTIKPSYVT